MMHPFFKKIIDEHAHIRATLEQKMKAGDGGQDFFAYGKSYVQDVHFEYMERFLFASVFNHADVRTGGPLCMLYFDQHLNNRSLDRAAKFCERKRFQPDTKNVPEHARQFYADNSPVCIPMEDHFACREVFLKATEVLPNRGSEEVDKELDFLMYLYGDIIRGLFEKVDNCLLPMCQHLLSTEALNDLQDRSDKWLNERQDLANPQNQCGLYFKE